MRALRVGFLLLSLVAASACSTTARNGEEGERSGYLLPRPAVVLAALLLDRQTCPCVPAPRRCSGTCGGSSGRGSRARGARQTRGPQSEARDAQPQASGAEGEAATGPVLPRRIATNPTEVRPVSRPNREIVELRPSRLLAAPGSCSPGKRIETASPVHSRAAEPDVRPERPRYDSPG
jgi:hypothetical protein